MKKKEDEAFDLLEREAEIKKTYGEDVVCITVEDAGKTYRSYLKKPDRYVVGKFMSTVTVNMTAALEEVYRICVIPEVSDSEIFDRDDLFLGAFGAIQDLIELKKSTSRKI